MSKGRHEAPKPARAQKKTAAIKSEETGSKSAEARRGRTNRRKKHNTVKVIVLVVLLLAAAALVGSILIGKGSTICPNVSLKGVEIGGMTVTEAEVALEKGGWSAQSIGSVEVILPGEYSFTVTAGDAGLDADAHEAAEAAMRYGHSGKAAADIKAYLRCLTGKVNEADILASADEESILTKLSEALSEYRAMLSKGYTLDTEKGELVIYKGAESISIDADKLCKGIIEALDSGKTELVYDIGELPEAVAADIEKIHGEVFKEPKDAAYDKEKHEATESVEGIDFNVEEAKAQWSAAKSGEAVRIKLIIIEPTVSAADLDGKLFADKLGSQKTLYKSSSEGRATNVELSAEKINGVILNPGEVFSFNDVVGKRTAEAGFKTAAAYAGGGVVQEIGGGICQTSSTLYCAALFANLQIVTRWEHGFAVSYVPYGMDATVSWGGPEFRFKNNRDYPIKIVAVTENRELTVEIWGTDVDGSYVEMTNSVKTRYDKTYPTVAIGTDAETYRSVFDKDGNLISRKLEAKSYYSYHKEEIKWPASPSPSSSAEPSDIPSPSPTATPSPTPTSEPTPTPSPSPTPTEPQETQEENPS